MPRSFLSPPAVVVLIAALSPPAIAGDAFFKGALQFNPSEAHISDRWLLSFGSDFPLNLSETAFLGFDLQAAWYRVPIGGASANVVPLNGFINAKFKAPTFGARPYAGGGLGTVTFLTFVEGSTDWNRKAGLHLLGGLELGSASIEFHALRILESDTEFTYWVLFGFVW